MRWVYDLAHKEKVVALPGATRVTPFVLNGTVGDRPAGSLTVFTATARTPTGCSSSSPPSSPSGRTASARRSCAGAPGTSWARAPAPRPRLGVHQAHHRPGGGPAVQHHGGEPGARCDRTSWTTRTSRTPTSRSTWRTSRTPWCTSSPPTCAGTEFETTVNDLGLPWYKGEVGMDDGLRTWNEAIQRVLDQPAVG